LHVAVLRNLEKKPLFEVEQRVEMIGICCEHLANVKVMQFRGLVVELVRQSEADVLLRGLRDLGDFRYEWETALVNRSLGNVETMFLMTDPSYAFISSTRIREIATLGGDVSNLVPLPVWQALGRRQA
jgi:pantetheine-phosphate adenylyltransferase